MATGAFVPSLAASPCVAPLSYVLGTAAHAIWREWERSGSIRVLIDTTHSSTLFNAVRNEIEEVAEARNDTSASEMEGNTMYDKKSGLTQVHLQAWASEPHIVWLELEGSRKQKAVLTRGSDVVTGRDNSLSRCEAIALQMRSSERNRLEERHS